MKTKQTPWARSLALTLGLLAALAPWLPAQATEYLGFLAYREGDGKPWQAPAVIGPKETPPDGDYAFQIVVTDPGEDLGIKPAPAGGWPKWVTLRGLFKVRLIGNDPEVIDRANLDMKSTLTDAQLIGLPSDRPVWGTNEQWLKVRPWLKPLIDSVETTRGKEKGSPDMNVLRAMMGEASVVDFVAEPNGTKNTFTLRRIHRLDPTDATYAKSIGQFWDPGNPNTRAPAEIQSDVASANQRQRGFWQAAYLGEPNRDQLEFLGFFSQFLNRNPARSKDPVPAEATKADARRGLPARRPDLEDLRAAEVAKAFDAAEAAKAAETAKVVPTWLLAVYIAMGLGAFGIAFIGAFTAEEWVKRHRPNLGGPNSLPRLRRVKLYQPRSPAQDQDAPVTMTAMPDSSLAGPQGTEVAGSTVDDDRRREIELASVTDKVGKMAVRLDQSNREATRWREQMNAEMTSWRKEVEADIKAALEKQKDWIKAITRRLDDYPQPRSIVTQPAPGIKSLEQSERPRPAQDYTSTTDAHPAAKDDAPLNTERGAMAALAESLVTLGAIMPVDRQALLGDASIANQRDLLMRVIRDYLAPSRPISEYRRCDDTIRRITQDRFALILPNEGEHISSTDHRTLGYRRVERGALGTVAEVIRPGLQSSEGQTKTTMLPAEVWETR